MNEKICSFCGHRTIITENPEEKIYVTLCNLIENHGYTSFYSGGMGEFDLLCERVVRKIKKEYPDIKLYRIMYRYKTDMENIKNLVDEIIIPDLGDVYYKKIIILRNRWMVEMSQCVLCHINKSYGGAYNTMKYAQSLGKEVVMIN